MNNMRKLMEAVGNFKENSEVKGVNDKYDDDTLKCKHCGDYYCTSKFGGECPKIQKDLFDEDDNSGVEDDDFLYTDAEYKMIKDVMAQRGHEPHSLGFTNSGAFAVKDDLAPGSPEYEIGHNGEVLNLKYNPGFDPEVHADADFNDWVEQNPFENVEETLGDKGTIGASDESDMYGEETFDEMVDYWKGSLSRSIVRKGVFTQLYTAANNNIDELNAAIADQAYSIAESYHGSGEGIGSSDQNHFIMHIGQSLGIDDLFGWNKPKVEEDSLDEEVVEVPAGLRGEEGSHLSSRDAEQFVNSLEPDDVVASEVIDPDTGDVVDWPTKDERRKQDDAEYQAQMDREEEEERQGLFKTPHIPTGDGDMERALDGLQMLRWDNKLTGYYDITWKSMEDMVDDPQQYYDGDYDISYDMPASIARTDGDKLNDEDHQNFLRLNKLFRTATYNIGVNYSGKSSNGRVAYFYPSFY